MHQNVKLLIVSITITKEKTSLQVVKSLTVNIFCDVIAKSSLTCKNTVINKSGLQLFLRQHLYETTLTWSSHLKKPIL